MHWKEKFNILDITLFYTFFQRHVIRMVPVTQCDYQHKDQSLNYFVYGLDCKVYAPTYPDQCCWGCTIL